MTSSIIRNIRACSLVFVLATFIGLAAAPAHALLLIDFTATVAPDPGGDADLTALYVGGGGIFAAGDPISGTFSYTTNGVTTQDPSNPDGLGRFIYANTNFASATVTATGLGPGAYPIATTTPGSTTALCDRDAVPACTSTLSPPGEDGFSIFASEVMGAPFIAPESLFLGITLFASDVGLLTAGTDLPKDTDVKSYLTSAGATGVTLIYFDLGSSALVLLPFDSLSFSVSNVVTPEPGSMLLIGAGLAGIAGLRRKRRKVAA